MTSVSILGSYMVVCGERPVMCFATREEARAHAQQLRWKIGECECFITEVLEMVSDLGGGQYHDIRVEKSDPILEKAA